MPTFIPRRIVTGVDTSGRSVFSRVEEMESSDQGPLSIAVYRVWGADRLPIELPTPGLIPQIEGGEASLDASELIRDMHPEGPPNGMRMSIYVWGPHTNAASTVGLHWHDTMDCFFIISGEFTLLSETAEVTLRPGDCVVVNGTNHVFENRTNEPAVMGLVSVGGIRVGASPPMDRALRWEPGRGYFFEAETPNRT